MAQLERTKRSSECPKTPRSQTSPTFEQLLRVDEAFWSPTTSPASGMNHDQEGYLSPSNNKKSVLTKVKEKAKKLRYTLSGRRKQGSEQGDDNSTPPWGVTLEDDDDDDDDDYEIDEDPEYLGAPMYESEAAPDILKETARQHPRAVPVVSEKHLVPNRNKHEDEKPVSPNTTLSEKLVPAYAAMSDATHKIASRIAGLTITTSEAQKSSPNTHVPSHDQVSEKNSGNLKQYAAATSPQTWDKGVSVKEYFMNKLEPGEDERALSQAITEAISPRKSTTGDSGVVEKVKDAVTSFFRQEEDPSNSVAKTASLSSNNLSPIPHNRVTPPTTSHSSKVFYPSTSNANSTPLIPLSSSSREVLDEENHGKTLQAN